MHDHTISIPAEHQAEVDKALKRITWVAKRLKVHPMTDSAKNAGCFGLKGEDGEAYDLSEILIAIAERM